ncbi:MAG: hypothetical protein WCS79_03185 [Paludibacter sp.]
MNSSKYIFNRLIITISLFILSPEIFPESPYKKTIYNAFINREMYKWKDVIVTIETKNPPKTLDQKLELINYYYGYIGYLIKKKQYETAEIYINKGEKLIDKLFIISPNNATIYSYKGSFIGYRITISKFKAFLLAAESSANLNKAYELDPSNVQANIDKGNIMFYAPPLFGGDKKEALKYYLKGAKLMETNRETDQNWAYLNILTMIAKIYEIIDQPLQANQTYEKILRKEPDFYWVKMDLYPKFREKHK